MGKTRVHLLAKELGIETKDLIAQLDRLGMRGRKAQSALEDDEVARVRAALAAQEKPQIHAKVFFNLLGDDVDKSEVLAGLKSATGFIRAKVGKQLNLRFVPAIEFVYDETEEEARRIEDLLKS